MPDLIVQLAKTIDNRLKTIGCARPSFSILKLLLQTAYHATLRTEEGRFIQSSITYAHPNPQPEDGPATRRADYPGLWALGRHVPLNVERLVKLARAIDMWSGSIGVYGSKAKSLYIWGVVDQLVQSNVSLNLEGERGFHNPGVLYITMDGVGDLTIYHQGIFLGGLRGHNLLIQERDALGTWIVGERILPHLERPAKAIQLALKLKATQVGNLTIAWINTIYRLCIGLRRYGTGGTLLITPSPRFDHLDIGYKFNYERLGDAMILNVLDQEYLRVCESQMRAHYTAGTIPYLAAMESSFAETDAQDRQSELTSAVKLVTSLASVDGLVLLSPLLQVKGFGVKIKTGGHVGTVYDGAAFQTRGTRAKKIAASRFGTRHNSVLRYCRLDKNAIGVVISQDGNVRIAMSTGRSLVLWDNVKLQGYSPYSRHSIRLVQDWARRHERTKRPTFGFTDTPKTVKALLRALHD